MNGVPIDVVAGNLSPTFAAKAVYVYVSPDPGHEGLVKVGDAKVEGLTDLDGVSPNSDRLNAAAEARIRQYTQTHGANWRLLHTELAVRKMKNGKLAGFRDHHVHDVLKASGVEQVHPNGASGREWYRTDLAAAIKAIAAVKAGRKALTPGEIADSQTPTPFTPRPEQEQFIQETMRSFKKNDRYLWNAKMRFGKTVTALELVRRMRSRKTIVVTHRPVVNRGWFEDFRKLVFVRPDDNWVYGSKESAATIDELCEHGARNLVYFASIQDLRGSSLVGGRFDKNDEIFATHWDCVIIDEAHEGTQTQLGDAVIQRLFPNEKGKRGKLLALSGTPFNILEDYADGVSTWDYVMEQEAKRNWAVLHGGDSNPYETLPRLSMFVYDLAAEIEGYKSEDISGAVFNFKEFFRVRTDAGNGSLNDGGTSSETEPGFAHEEDVKRFLDLLVSSESSSCFPFVSEENRSQFRHTLWMLPGVKEALALQRLLEGHPVFGSFKVLNVAGDGDPEDPSGEALKHVREGIASHEYTITLSCGKLTTGVTVPQWTAVLMLAGRYETSAIGYLQTIFRVQSPCEEDGFVKENAYVFDFAPDRTLRVMADAARLSAANRRSGGGGDRHAALGELLNFCPVVAIKGSRMRAYDADALMQELKRALAARAVMSGFSDDSIYDDEMLRADRVDARDFERLRTILKDAKVGEVVKGKISVNRHGLTEEEREEAERVERRKRAEISEAEKELLRRLREEREAKRNFKALLRTISIRMLLMLYGVDWTDPSSESDNGGDSPDEDVSLDRFIDRVDAASWAEFMPHGVTKAFFGKFRKYYDKDIFANAARNVRDEIRQADSLMPEERIPKIGDIFWRFRNPDKETVLTPWRTVNRHLALTLGGYVFFSEDFSKDLKGNPRFADLGDVTAETLGNASARILEINSKTGLYPLYVVYSLYRARLNGAVPATPEEAFEVWDAVCRENVFALALTPMAASITRRTLVGYRAATTRIKVMPKLIDRLKKKGAIPGIVAEIKRASTWGLPDGEIGVDAVVGNPPYQLKGLNDGDRDNPIYHLFMDLSYAASEKSSLITPGRFLFNAGQTPKDWNRKMLGDEHLKVVLYEQKTDGLFPGIDIKGGVTVTYHDGRRSFGKVGTYTVFSELNSILRKVLACTDGKPMLDGIVSSQGVFRFTKRFFDERPEARALIGKGTNSKIVSKEFETLPQIFTEKPPAGEDCIEIVGRLGGERVSRFVRRDYVEYNEYLERHKVLVPEANGTGAIGEVLSSPMIGEPMIGFTDTFIAIGSFATKAEADSCMKYVKTKFARAMLGVLKVTQHNTKSTWRYVPLQDFTSGSDIDWSASVSEIDARLYAKYGLSATEREFIETRIRPMA